VWPTSDFDRMVERLGDFVKASRDTRLLPFYGEYLVASELAKRGHEVEVLKKRRGPDLQVRDGNYRIEVKTSRLDSPEWSCTASFRKGQSIKRGDFDFCVFVTFANFEPKECLVFSRDELLEVAERPRPYPISTYPSNPCLLYRFKDLKEYKRAFPNGRDRLEIEVRLHRSREEFKDRWDKIVPRTQHGVSRRH